MREGGSLILAGLLRSQVGSVAKAYRTQGLRLAAIGGSEEWPCLHLRNRTRYAYARPKRASGRTSQRLGDFGTL
jgi:ribosomal protein L11 methyltransferase